MASFRFLLLLLFLCHSFDFLFKIHAQISFSSSQDSVLLPVRKDPKTLQYITQFYHGNSKLPTDLVIDLGGSFLWYDCSSTEVSSQRHVVPSCSIQCAMANKFLIKQKSCFSDTSWQYPSICDLSVENGITRSKSRGELAEETISVRSGSKSGKIIEIENYLSVCSSAVLLNGLASGAQGMLGLGRTPTAFPSQISTKLNSFKKFATCFSSSNGVIAFGNKAIDSIFGPEISNSLTYTPLITINSQGHFIRVRSIKINGKRLALGKKSIEGGTKISTTAPFTTLESSIYSTAIKAYKKAVNSMNLTMVDPVSPFGLCFSSEGIETTNLGPNVPAIDLILQSEMIKWRIHGRNSMVNVSDEVMCLGLLDGGVEADNPIVIGGFQLEDRLLEFNLGNSMLGFSLINQKSCSDLVESRGMDIL